MQQRSNFVPSNGGESTRNTFLSGRTGTRCNVGRPQTRWADGVNIAQHVLNGRTLNSKGTQALSIGTAIMEAMDTARAFVEQFQPNS